MGSASRADLFDGGQGAVNALSVGDLGRIGLVLRAAWH